MSPAFLEVLRQAASQYPTQQALADALGMTLQRVNAALQGRGYAFNVANCLTLAHVANLPPSTVLRAAGKAREAELIERLYGSVTLTSGQRELLDLWMHLSTEARMELLALMRRLAQRRRR